MKHPATAATVLALHLLGLLSLLEARPAVVARDPAALQRTTPASVLWVSVQKDRPAAEPPAMLPRSQAPRAAGLSLPEVSGVPDSPAVPGAAEVAAVAHVPHVPPVPAEPAGLDLAIAPAEPLARSAPLAASTAAPATAEPAVTAAGRRAGEAPATVARADRDHCPPASHPAALRERGIEGEVRLLVRVGTDGRAVEVRLQQASGWRLFDHAAMAQAQACRFVPARRGVQAVESWVEYPVRFSLSG